jgi:Fe-S cluster assembly protein SufD
MSTTIEKRNLSSEIAESIRKQLASPDRVPFLEQFEKIQLPVAKSEEYKFAPIVRILEKSFQEWPAKSVGQIDTRSLTSFVPGNIAVELIVFINGEWSKDHSRITRPDISISQRPNNSSLPSDDPFATLNRAAADTKLVVTIEANSNVENPLCILYVLDATKAPVACHSAVEVILSENAKAGFIQRTIQLGEHATFHNALEEITILPGAHLDYYKIQDSSNVIQVCNTLVRQESSSQVNTFTLTLDGKAIRNNLHIRIDGEGCESHFHGLYLLRGDTLADNHTVVDHQKPNSFSNEMYKGVMDDQSKGVFNGKIFVRPHAQKTNAFQSNRNILLSDKASINTKPQLEIWADDVKCSHGCTTGQLDEEAMFYLQSRGIPKDTARAMLLYAFASEVLQIVPNTLLRNYMDELVSERLHKDF